MVSYVIYLHLALVSESITKHTRYLYSRKIVMFVGRHLKGNSFLFEMLISEIVFIVGLTEMRRIFLWLMVASLVSFM